MLSAAHLLLCAGDSLLMIRRFDTGFEDGNYSVVAGHIEAGESALEAMSREAREEAGIDLGHDDLEFVHVMHRRSGDGSVRMDLFFRCVTWSGEVANREPHKCDEMTWFDRASLPHNTVPSVSAALSSIDDGRTFSEFGW
jgi:8-oxo-dGTP diphosphatase